MALSSHWLIEEISESADTELDFTYVRSKKLLWLKRLLVRLNDWRPDKIVVQIFQRCWESVEKWSISWKSLKKQMIQVLLNESGCNLWYLTAVGLRIRRWFGYLKKNPFEILISSQHKYDSKIYTAVFVTRVEGISYYSCWEHAFSR